MNIENKFDGCKTFYSDVDPFPAAQTGLRVRKNPGFNKTIRIRNSGTNSPPVYGLSN